VHPWHIGPWATLPSNSYSFPFTAVQVTKCMSTGSLNSLQFVWFEQWLEAFCGVLWWFCHFLGMRPCGRDVLFSFD
jgi:hypothetical protein